MNNHLISIHKAMKKYLLPLIALMAMPLVFTSCSDDDDKAPAVTIKTGEIPSKNVFVTIDGKFIGPAAGATEITGNVNPSATEQHLQLKCPSMFIINTGSLTTDGPLVKSVPVFDVTVTTLNGKTTLNGNFSGEGYEIDVTGEVTVNYAGENDWKLNFEQKKTFFTKDNYYNGKTIQIEFSKDWIFCRDPLGTTEQIEKIVSFFDNLSPAFVTNSGMTAARLVFKGDTYELWFKDGKTGEYVKDESEHRYLADGLSIYFLDEPGFKKKQAEFFSLKPMGLNYTNTPMNFAEQTMAYELGSAKEWCVTALYYSTKYDDRVAMSLGYAEHNFFTNWENKTDKETAADKEFALLQKWEKDGEINVNPVVLFEEVE